MARRRTTAAEEQPEDIDRVPVRPMLADGRAIDVREAMVRAIEREISRRFGGNSVLNRLEAEAQLELLLGARGDAQMQLGEMEKDHGKEE